MLPRPYAPIIPLGRGSCEHVSEAGVRKRRMGGKKKRKGGSDGAESKGKGS